MSKNTFCLTLGSLLAAAGVAGVAGALPLPQRTTGKLANTFKQLRSEESGKDQGEEAKEAPSGDAESTPSLQTATFGTGCFWCTEAIFEELHGVHDVVSGFSGGRVANPSYEQVLTGQTGHAEVVQLRYDPQKISFAKLLEVFWTTHDPTTLNRQGPDVGTQYRSAVFFHNDEQRDLARRYKAKLDAAKVFRNPIVTEITEYTNFYPAKGYHQDFFAQNGRVPYCRYVIQPKMKKFRRVFREELKRNNQEK